MSLSVIELLKHIRDEMAFLMEDSRHYTYDSIINDKKAILSYTRSFGIIGEACKSIPDTFTQYLFAHRLERVCRVERHYYSSIFWN